MTVSRRDFGKLVFLGVSEVTLLLANKLRLLTLAAGDNTSPGLEITGDADVLASLVGVLDKPDPGFNIVTP